MAILKDYIYKLENKEHIENLKKIENRLRSTVKFQLFNNKRVLLDSVVFKDIRNSEIEELKLEYPSYQFNILDDNKKEIKEQYVKENTRFRLEVASFKRTLATKLLKDLATKHKLSVTKIENVLLLSCNIYRLQLINTYYDYDSEQVELFSKVDIISTIEEFYSLDMTEQIVCFYYDLLDNYLSLLSLFNEK